MLFRDRLLLLFDQETFQKCLRLLELGVDLEVVALEYIQMTARIADALKQLRELVEGLQLLLLLYVSQLGY